MSEVEELTEFQKWWHDRGALKMGGRDISFAGKCFEIEKQQQATIAKLRAALKKFGLHDPQCGYATPEGCRCGLDAALREAGEGGK